MKEKNRWDSEGNYHDDDVRLNNYAEVADIRLERTELSQNEFDSKTNVFIEKVVQSIQGELGMELMRNPALSPVEIKLRARNRFLNLVQRELLSKDEADICYKRFAYLVDYYYGAS